VSSDFVFARATTAAEIEAVQRLRHAVYVEELGRYGDAAGTAGGRFAEPEDEYSWLFYARDGDRVVAATRTTWGADGFSDRQVDQYQLAPFLAEIPAELMAVGERNSVLPAYRGTGVFDELMAYGGAFNEGFDLRVVFGCCEPHLLPLANNRGMMSETSHADVVGTATSSATPAPFSNVSAEPGVADDRRSGRGPRSRVRWPRGPQLRSSRMPTRAGRRWP
jgi:hypothetical protein